MYDVTTAKLFLLDMDGTFYLDDTLLPGALEFLALCRATGRQFAFLTNNSSKSKADYLAKLTRLGADVTEHDIFTSGDATLLYLAENGFPKISCSSARPVWRRSSRRKATQCGLRSPAPWCWASTPPSPMIN